MTGFTLGSRETAILRQVVAAAGTQTEMPLPWQLLHQLQGLLRADCTVTGTAR